MKQRFQKYGLKEDRYYPNPIVAFRENTSFVHYYASEKFAKKLEPNSLILLDIWAKLDKGNAPFADITWMGYYGEKFPKDMERIFKIVTGARDEAVKFIKADLRKKVLPKGEDVDRVARDHIAKNNFGKYFLHGTGHPLGLKKDHGPGTHLNFKGKNKLSKLMGYTIEPGIYIKNEFGFRSEMDFYVDEKWKMQITAPLQKKIIKILPH